MDYCRIRCFTDRPQNKIKGKKNKMAQSIDEINITNFVNTGQTRQMNRYTFVLEIKWTDNQGIKQTYGPTIHDFPDDLSTMPLEVRRAFVEKMITAVVRVSLGIDTWEIYT